MVNFDSPRDKVIEDPEQASREQVHAIVDAQVRSILEALPNALPQQTRAAIEGMESTTKIAWIKASGRALLQATELVMAITDQALTKDIERHLTRAAKVGNKHDA